jgi:predicted phage tail protein
VGLSGLSASTTYYWHVRAINSFGTTYANGSSTSFWSFTTGNPPVAFNKSLPANGATDQPSNPTLSWGASSEVTSYEYCYDTSNDNTCSGWTNNGTATSVGLSGLSTGTTYYWHVRAVNSFGTTYANGSSAAFWSFTTGTFSFNYLPSVMK